MNITEASKSLASTDGFFRHWMPYVQRVTLTQLLMGEEARYFADLLTKLKARIEAMPKSYETDGQGDDAVAHLHYFKGTVDAWITEKDAGGPDDEQQGAQIQAFGKVNLYGTGVKDAELGYISIEELIETDVELDLYWTPKPLKEC